MAVSASSIASSRFMHLELCSNNIDGIVGQHQMIAPTKELTTGLAVAESTAQVHRTSTHYGAALKMSKGRGALFRQTIAAWP